MATEATNAGAAETIMEGTLHVDITIEKENLEEQVEEFLLQVFPSLTKEDIDIYVFPNSLTTGLMNKMVKCSWKKGDIQPEAVIVRVKNIEIFKDFVRYRATEEAYVKTLHQKGCAPKLVATFKNGFCYEYVKGEVLTEAKISQQPICWLIAEELAKIHSCDIDHESIKRSPYFTNRKDLEMFQAMFPKQLNDPERNERFLKEYPSLETITNEIEIILQHLESLEQETYVLCHNDVRAENIIYNEENGKVHFIDFEGVGYSSAALEVASHFLKYCGIDPPNFSKYPTEEFQKEWIRIYLKNYYQNKGMNGNRVPERDVDRFYVLKEKYKLLMLIINVLLGPTLEVNKMPIDCFSFGLENLKHYYEEKERIISMEMPQ